MRVWEGDEEEVEVGSVEEGVVPAVSTGVLVAGDGGGGLLR